MKRNEISFGGVSGFPEEDSVKASGKPAITGGGAAARLDFGREGPSVSEQMAGSEAVSETQREEAAIPGRPPSSQQEYQRVMFLARLVLGFTILAALTLGIVAVATGRDFASIGVGVLLVAAAAGYYTWTSRSVKRDLAANQRTGSEE